MSIIEDLKQFIGYTGTDLDTVFCILAIVIVLWFASTFFNIINWAFGIKRYH